MKKMILPTICFLALTVTASAQTRNSRRRGSTSSSVTTTSAVNHQTQTATTARPENDNTTEQRPSSTQVIPDNRKEYMIDGQLATYTGHQATPVNSDEFQSLRKEDNKKEEN